MHLRQRKELALISSRLVFAALYREGLNRSQALDRVEHDIEPVEEIRNLVSFYRNSQRGVA